MDIISYSELRKQSKVFAREVIRKVLNFGKGMDGLTPTQKLKKYHLLINEYVLLFPTILMENLFKYGYSILQSIMLKSGGQYVHTKCHLFVETH